MAVDEKQEYHSTAELQNATGVNQVEQNVLFMASCEINYRCARS